jgi:hypothetical protein
MEFLLVAQMAGNPGLQPTQRATKVDVVGLGEINLAQSPNGNPTTGWKTQHQGVTARLSFFSAAGFRGFRAGLWHKRIPQKD